MSFEQKGPILLLQVVSRLSKNIYFNLLSSTSMLSSKYWGCSMSDFVDSLWVRVAFLKAAPFLSTPIDKSFEVVEPKPGLAIKM